MARSITDRTHVRPNQIMYQGGSTTRPVHPPAQMATAVGNDLDPRTRAELERRGAANVRLLIANDNWVGAGEQSAVEIGGGEIPRPSRAQVESWLKEQDQAEAALLASRHRQVMTWAIAATIAGIVGVLISILQWMNAR